MRSLGVVKRSFICFFVGVMILSSMFFITPMNPLLTNANAASSWVETSDSDFTSGKLTNVEIACSGTDAELRLKSITSCEWYRQYPNNAPSIRRGHVISGIYNMDKVILFGGYHSNVYYNETWEYDLSNNTWTNLQPTGEVPTPRHSHIMTWIYGEDKVLLFGGYTKTGMDNNTYVYDHSENKWTKKSSGPEAREYHAAASIYDDDRVIVFGGYNGTGYLNDTWVYDLSKDAWTKKSPINSPSPRKDAEMATIFDSDDIVLFGGNVSGKKLENDTWIYELSKDAWTKKNPTGTSPSPRRGHGMATIHGTDNILLFGLSKETWRYDSTNNKWTLCSPKDQPSQRYINQCIGTIWDTDNVVLFGGGYVNSTWADYNDTWVFNYSDYVSLGNYISKDFDTGKSSSFSTLIWNATLYPNTVIKFQIRTAASKSGLSNKTFVGPDGNGTTYYKLTPATIWSGHYKDRWLQYKAYLSTGNKDVTPRLKDVTIFYTNLNQPENVNPLNNSIISTNTPTFIWENKYRTGFQQTAFQVQLAKDPKFIKMEYDSGKQSSNEPLWEFPTGTEYQHIADGTWYWQVRTKGQDGYWGFYSEPFMITIDTTGPNSNITYPENGEYYNYINKITGLGWDTFGNIAKVELTIQRMGDGFYWSGTAWGKSEIKLLAVGKFDWSYDTKAITWDSGEQYIIRTTAVDIANNYQTLPYSIKFTYETERPNSNINEPKDNSWFNRLDKITGRSFDEGGSGIDIVELSIKCRELNKYWNGNDWDYDEHWLLTEGLETWSYNSLGVNWETGYTFYLNSRAIDMAGNFEDTSGPGNVDKIVTFMFDSEVPICNVEINNGDKYTNSQEVNLKLSADDSGSGVSLMSFSYDNIDWTNWEPYYDSILLELPLGDGEKEVYFKVMDVAGNILSEPVFDTIILDTIAPTGLTIIINGGALEANSSIVILTLGATDATGELDQMSFSEDGVSWTPWEEFASEKKLSLSSGVGEKIVYFKVKDKAGNEAEPVIEKIQVNTQELDTDNDNYPDHLDAFPTDPAAALDSDGDKYPDAWNSGKTQADSTTGLSLDQFPFDPRLHYRANKEQSEDQLFNEFVVLILLTIVIMILVITYLIVRNRRTHFIEQIETETDNDELLENLKNEILTGENSDEPAMTKIELLGLYNTNYPPGVLATETSVFVENIIEDTEVTENFEDIKDIE